VDPLWHLGLAIGLTLLVSVPLGVSMWALLDAARRPQWAWALAGRSQVAWMGGILFGTLTLVVGVAVSAWYLLKIRPLVAAAEEGHVEL
jgi:hypothetical protein